MTHEFALRLSEMGYGLRFDRGNRWITVLFASFELRVSTSRGVFVNETANTNFDLKRSYFPLITRKHLQDQGGKFHGYNQKL